MPLLEQHVGHSVITRVDEEPLHSPDLTIGGVDVLPGTHVCLAHRNDVLDDHSRMSGLSAIFHAGEPTADAFHAGHQLTLRSVVEPIELCESAAHADRSEEHTSELQSLRHLVCRLLLEKKKKPIKKQYNIQINTYQSKIGESSI